MSVFYTPHTSDSNGISIEYIPLERDTPRLWNFITIHIHMD